MVQRKSISTFKIIFKAQPAVYFPGQSISGLVVLDLKQQIQLQSIQANLFGCSSMHVTVGNTDNRNHIVKNETFIDHKLELWNYGK